MALRGRKRKTPSGCKEMKKAPPITDIRKAAEGN
jgi:hypothetical protein